MYSHLVLFVSNSAILEQVAQIMIFEWQQNAGIMNYDKYIK
jgi:hypothetical protein